MLRFLTGAAGTPDPGPRSAATGEMPDGLAASAPSPSPFPRPPSRISSSSSRLAALTLVALAAAAPAASAQTVETGQGTFEGLPLGARNGVFVLDSDAGRLFVGPRMLVVDPDGTQRYEGGDDAFDPITAVDPRVFTVDARTTDAGQTVFAGLGFSDTSADADEPPSTAAGFAVSRDGGRTWVARSPALDETFDTAIPFGVSTLAAVPVTAPQGAPPLDLALTPGADTAYVASAAAGIRRSTDGGATWQRIVLPPDSLVVLDPREPQFFTVAAQGEVLPDETRSREALNFFAYSVLVAEDGTVWAGTFSGLNRSVTLPGVADLAWLRYLDSPFGNAPVGNHIYALEERPREGTDEVWAACWVSPDDRSAPDEEFGVIAWTGDDADGQPVFETKLLGVRVFDLAFDGERAYAASDAGLHIADDADTPEWRVVRVFRGADGAPLPLPEDTGVFAVAVTPSDAGPSTLWAGTAEGVLRSTDAGATWTLFRASVPTDPGLLDPGIDPDEVPEVDVYAYPNPFTPRTDGFARVRFDLDAGDDVTVRVYDFGMRLVRTLDAPGRPAGANEVLWDGLSDRGTRVANGAYVYVVDAGGEQLSGKLLVFE